LKGLMIATMRFMVSLFPRCRLTTAPERRPPRIWHVLTQMAQKN
jgi:hypothetical protein